MKWRTLNLLILCTPQSKGYPGSDSVCIAHSNSPGYPLDEKYIYNRFCVSANDKPFFKIVQAFKRHMSIRMRAFAYMKTKIFLQSEGRTGSMGRGCQEIHAVNGNKKDSGTTSGVLMSIVMQLLCFHMQLNRVTKSN